MESQVSVKPLPFFYVGRKISADRITRFRNLKHKVLSEKLGRPDTCSIWYSKEHFEKLLAEIDFAGGDGVRIHFGMYEEGHQFAGQLCLLFTSTRAKYTGGVLSHENVILENEPAFEDRLSLPREVIFFPGDDQGEIKDFNLGSPCPPLCDDGDGGLYP